MVYYPRKQGTWRGIADPAADVSRTSKSVAQVFHAAFGLRGDEETFIGGKQGALTGSIFSKVPTILVEMVFLTRPQDAEWFKQMIEQKAHGRSDRGGRPLVSFNQCDRNKDSFSPLLREVQQSDGVAAAL